ncbi:MAG: hypothetical protein IT507_07130 [Burkholderiaceae bacterium]|nr:hypothetical protein [Burkholderiaceae bacterium]
MREMNQSGNAAGRRILGVAAFAALLATGGCADQLAQMKQSGFYDPPPPSSLSDAMARADAAHSMGTIRAPNQIQVDLRRDQSQTAGGTTPAAAMPAGPMRADSGAAAPVAVAAGSASPAGDAPPQNPGALPISQSVAAANAATVQSQLIPEAQTFTGTVPCFHSEMRCTAQRITLTLAPNGRWRARAAYLERTGTDGGAQLEQGCWRAVLMAQPRVVILTPQGNVRADLAVINAGNALQLGSINGQVPNLTYTLSRQPDLDSIDELNSRPAPNCS